MEFDHIKVHYISDSIARTFAAAAAAAGAAAAQTPSGSRWALDGLQSLTENGGDTDAHVLTIIILF